MLLFCELKREVLGITTVNRFTKLVSNGGLGANLLRLYFLVLALRQYGLLQVQC